MDKKPRRSREDREARLAQVRELASTQAGIVSRTQVYGLGLTRSEVRAHVRAGRWQRIHSQSLAVHTAELTEEAQWWAALFEAGDRARLDGETSLVASGLEHYRPSTIRISVPRGVAVRRVPGATIRQTRRWREEDLAPSGIRRTRVPVAAVRAGIWAKSDKQAALLLTMAVQQGMTTPERIGVELLTIKRDKRRRFLHAVVDDLLGGVRSLGELEVAQECRRRGLPQPSRQAVRKGTNGRYYLDLFWEEWGVVVEVDGIHHTWASQVVSDALRQNDLALNGEVVLRLPLLGLRVAPDDFFAQISQALADAGCPLAEAAA